MRTLASALLAAAACLVATHAGAQSAAPGLQGSIFLGTRGADPRTGAPGTLGGSLDLTGRVAPGTTLTVAFLRGPRVNQPPPLPFASQQGDRYSLELRSRAWSLTAGNTLYSAGTAVTGAGVQVQGAAVRRTAGKVVGELAAGRPMTLGSDPAGLAARGRLGITTKRGVVALVASDVRREATPYLPATHVRGAGIDAQLAGRRHRLVARAGALRAEGRGDSARSGFAGETQYSFAGPGLTFAASGRVMPGSVTGAQLPGNELSGDVGIHAVGRAWLVGRASTATTRIYGIADPWRTEVLAGGFRVTGKKGARLDLRANYREYESSTRLIRRTLTGSAGIPVGRLALDGTVEVGHQVQNGARRPISAYRGGVRWTGRDGYASFSGTYQDYAAGARTLRWDAAGSLKRKAVEVDGGAWITRGPVYGASPGAWANVALPVGHGFAVITGAEYMRWTPATAKLLPATQPLPPDSVREEPGSGLPTPWRLTLGFRRALSVPLRKTR